MTCDMDLSHDTLETEFTYPSCASHVFDTLLKTISIFSTTADHKLHSYYTDFSCIYGIAAAASSSSSSSS